MNRLFVTSHRLGAATRPAIVIPALAAVRARDIDAYTCLVARTGCLRIPVRRISGEKLVYLCIPKALRGML
jgi:hypothetical protein